MKRERMHRVPVPALSGVTIDYFLTMDDACEKDRYGISIVVWNDCDPVEEYATQEHIGGDRQEICRLIDRMAQGEVFPVSLSEILDDYLGEIEKERKENL